MSILDQYVTSAYTPQEALDIFKGEWSSKLPEPLAGLESGSIPLFEDGRIEWAVAQLGGIESKTVIELGPLEAGHSYMLERLGAESILSVEANSHAYLKCLIVKELLDLKRVRFVYGDCIEYLRSNRTKFDVCIASGILYHMRNPVELIALAAQASDQIFLWTHYYDKAIISKNPNLAHKFPSSKQVEHCGFRHTLYSQEYKVALNWGGFCGGSEASSNWLSRDDILGCLKHFGLNNIEINFDHPDHPNGPSFALVATR